MFILIKNITTYFYQPINNLLIQLRTYKGGEDDLHRGVLRNFFVDSHIPYVKERPKRRWWRPGIDRNVVDIVCALVSTIGS